METAAEVLLPDTITDIQNDTQNLHPNSFSKNALGAWTCNHSNHPHLTATDMIKPTVNATMATFAMNINAMIYSITISNNAGNVSGF